MHLDDREGKQMDAHKEIILSREDFSLFYDVSTSIHAIRDLDEMLKTILGKIKQVFAIEGASIVLHDPVNREFYFIRTVEVDKDKDPLRMRTMRFPDHLGVAGWVLREDRPVIIQDVSRDPRFFGGMDTQGDFVTRSMICVPLKTRRGFLGVLYALNKLKGEFTSRDARILEVLSGPIAVSIENARLYGELKHHLSSLEQQNRQLASVAQARFNMHGIIGSSPAMHRLFTLMEKVIDTTTTVLIQGETGTGKELIAKVIHYTGPLKDRPFVAENCAALTETILESELFGHVRGAFTGAISHKKGLFEIADGGTILLDEIGEMPLKMQVKLLRVLQEGQFRPVGGSRYKKVNVRLIACTNRDLEDEVKKGNFRADLLYRINVFPITTPPLRERRQDIPLLTNHFLGKISKRLGWPQPDLSPAAMDLLVAFDWPGNVRQLENEIERAMTIAGRGNEITEEHLSYNLKKKSGRGHTLNLPSGTLKEVVQQVEQQMIRDALKDCNGNRSKAARMLGLTRQGLLNKISRYGLA